MEDETSDGTKRRQFRIAKLKLPTLTTKNIQSHHHNLPIHDMRSEAAKAPPMLATLFSSSFFRTRRSSGAQHINRRLQKPSFIPNNPLNMFTELFSKIKQGSDAENAQPLLAKFFPNTTSIRLWKPDSIPNNPLKIWTQLFSEIKQELAMEARKLSHNQKKYLEECMKRSESPYNTTKTSETANAVVSKFKNDLSFLVRLFLEILEGPEDTKIKAAWDNAWLHKYSNMKSNVGSDMPLPPNNVATNQFRDVSSYQNTTATSGFNSMLNNKRR